MLPGLLGEPPLLATGPAQGRALGGGGPAAADAKPAGDPGERPAVVPVQLDGKTTLAGYEPGRGGVARHVGQYLAPSGGGTRPQLR